MFKHILVATDGSKFSQDTVRRAVSFAKEAGARITALHAKPEYRLPYHGDYGESAPTYNIETPEQFVKRAEENSQVILGDVEKLCREAGVLCTKLSVTSNSPYEAIINAATENACDLIFMASHGRRGLSALLMGSETTKVLTHTKIPVLVYR